MRRHIRMSRATIAAAALVIALALAAVEPALAHEGHEHAADSGFNATVALQVGGTAVAIGMAYLLASLLLRWRDGRDR